MNSSLNSFLVSGAFLVSISSIAQKDSRPNILYIMADDHATQAISIYGGQLGKILPTPNIDRIRKEGAVLQDCFCTNSISTPSRAAILTGQYSQKNGVYTLNDKLDPSRPNLAKDLQAAGYQTAMIGKWHLGTEPTGFDWYSVLPEQGKYYNPQFIEKGSYVSGDFDQTQKKTIEGHVTDVTTDLSLEWLTKRNKEKPFFLMCHFKAPHRSWEPAERFKQLLNDVVIPEPANLLETYESRGECIQNMKMSLENLNSRDLKQPIPSDMSRDKKRKWAYQIYLKDYLRCVAGIDESVGQILKYLDDNHLTENTIIIYTSDQGFFLGEHGWFDKRMMMDESIRMPFLIRYPKEIKKQQRNSSIVLNIDFAPTLLDYADVNKPHEMQGKSFRSLLRGESVARWRDAMYYRYWMNDDGDHHVPAHYGIRTKEFKLIYFYNESLGKSGTGSRSLSPVWELYDLRKDPHEMRNIYFDVKYKTVVSKLKIKLKKLREKYQDKE
ncbi:MAG: sulfatase [Bacteroidales bacterium]|nr:sulfatase [Bacteroidales bacterium]